MKSWNPNKNLLLFITCEHLSLQEIFYFFMNWKYDKLNILGISEFYRQFELGIAGILNF